MTVREEAEFVRLALAMGLIGRQQVVDWADRVIAARDMFPNEVIDVSLGPHRPAQEILSLLAEMPGDGDLAGVAHQVLGLLRRRFLQGSVSLAEAGKMLSAYRGWARVPYEEAVLAGNCGCVCEDDEWPEEIACRDIESFLKDFAAQPPEDAPW